MLIHYHYVVRCWTHKIILFVLIETCLSLKCTFDCLHFILYQTSSYFYSPLHVRCLQNKDANLKEGIPDSRPFSYNSVRLTTLDFKESVSFSSKHLMMYCYESCLLQRVQHVYYVFFERRKDPQENVSLCPVVILTDGKVICFYIRVVPGHNSRYIYMINYESIMLYMRAGIQYHIKAICQRCKKDDSNIFQNW